MEDFSIVALFLFVLFLLLGTGVWVALALMGVAWVGMVLFTDRAGWRRHVDDNLVCLIQLDPDGVAALHLDG